MTPGQYRASAPPNAHHVPLPEKNAEGSDSFKTGGPDSGSPTRGGNTHEDP